MFKLKNTMIAALALASVGMPSLAHAGDLGREFKDQRSQLSDLRDQFHDLREAFKNGDISRDYYLEQRQKLRDQAGEIKKTLDELKKQRASN